MTMVPTGLTVMDLMAPMEMALMEAQMNQIKKRYIGINRVKLLFREL